jgi:hypothetical protein
MATQSNVPHSNPRSKSAAIIRRLRAYRSPAVEVPAARKPEVVILAHVHVCAACGKVHICEARPCWLRYRSHAKQWEWTCPKCSGPDEPAVAIAA